MPAAPCPTSSKSTPASATTRKTSPSSNPAPSASKSGPTACSSWPGTSASPSSSCTGCAETISISLRRRPRNARKLNRTFLLIESTLIFAPILITPHTPTTSPAQYSLQQPFTPYFLPQVQSSFSLIVYSQQFKCEMFSQLSKRHIKRPIQPQTAISTFLSLKEEAVQLLNQLDLYRQNSISNYYLHIAKITQEMPACATHEQGELFLLLCQTAVRLTLPLDSLRLPHTYPDLVIQYVNHLLEEGDTARLKQQTTRDVYQGRFKTMAQARKQGDQRQKFRDLLLIQRIDIVLAAITEAVDQQLNVRLSKLVLEFMEGTLRLAEKYLGIAQFLDFQANVETLIQFHSKAIKTVSRNTSLPTRLNYVIIDQTTADFHEPQMILTRKEYIKPRSMHRTSSRVQAKTSSLHDSIQMQNFALEEKNTLNQYSSLRLKGSLKRGSGTYSVTKRGSIQDKKSVDYVVRKSTHFIGKNLNEGKGLPGQRISRFNQLSKNQINALKEEFSSHKSQFTLYEQEPVLANRRQTSRFSNATNEMAQTIRPFYLFLQEDCRTTLLVFQHSHQSTASQTKLATLLFDSYPVVSPELLTSQMNLEDSQDQEQKYLSQIVQLLQVYRNLRNQLTFSIKHGYSRQQTNGNIICVKEPQRGLLMGFVRKISTYFIVQCFFDPSQLPKCCLTGIKRRLLNENQNISFPVTFNYQLMNQDLYMNFQQIQHFVKSKGSVIVIQEKHDKNQQPFYFGQENYKVTTSNFTVKQLSQVKFGNVWWKNSLTLLCEPPRTRRKDKRSGTQIMKVMKMGTNFDSKRLKRIVRNKSSVKYYQNQLQKIIQSSYYVKINSNYKISSRREVPTCEQLSSQDRIARPQNKKKSQLNRGKQLITSIRTQKGYKLMRKWVVQQPQTVKYNEYYGYLERRASLIEYYKDKSSFSVDNQNNYLKSSLTIHGKRNKIEAKNTKLLTFLKRLKNESALLGYLVGSIKLLIKDKNKYVFVEVYWQSMQKYFVFIISQDIFEKITQIQLDNFEKHPFSTSADKQQSKKREKRTSVVSSLMRSREKDNLKKSNQSQTKTLKVPKVISMERQNESTSKAMTIQKMKSRTNTFFRIDKTSESFSFSTFNNMKLSQRLHFKREVASYIKSKFIKYAQFVWKQYSLIMEIHNPNKSGQRMYEIEGKELAVKNIHMCKNVQKSKGEHDEWQVSATELLVIRYKQSNLANLKFFTSEGLNKIYLQHLFLKNNDDLFGCYRNKLCLRELNDNRSRIAQFYSKENGFFENVGKELDNSVPLSQPHLKHFFSKHSNKEEQKRYKYAEIINFAKKCSLAFDFIEKKRKNMLKEVFVIPNRYPHLQLQQFMISVEITFEDIFIKDLNGQILLGFSKQKLVHYFPYIFRVPKAQFKTLLVNRLLKDEDLIRLCQVRHTTFF